MIRRSHSNSDRPSSRDKLQGARQFLRALLDQDPVADIVQQAGKPRIIGRRSASGERLAGRRGALCVESAAAPDPHPPDLFGACHCEKISADNTRLRTVAKPKYVTASLIRTIGLRSRKKAELVICSTLLAMAASALTMSPISAAVTRGLREGGLQ